MLAQRSSYFYLVIGAWFFVMVCLLACGSRHCHGHFSCYLYYRYNSFLPTGVGCIGILLSSAYFASWMNGGQKPFGGAEQISQLGMSLTPSGLPISFFPIEAGRIVIVLVSLLRRRALSYDGAFPDCHLFVKGRRLEFISNGSAGDSQHVTSVYASLPAYRSSYSIS